MAASNGDIRFHQENIFAGQTGIIDYNNAIIKGVSLITGGIEAEGHNLTVDNQTLSELRSCALKRGKIPVQLDHGSGISATCGYLTDFRLDGNKLRGDLHLLTSHEETPRLLERAEKMPDCFGLSVAFKGPPKGVPIGGGKMAARCEKLLSVDLVTRPAANEGLFSVPEVDKGKKGMAQENAGLNTGGTANPPTLEDIVAQLAQISQRLDQQEQFNQQVAEVINGDQGQGEDELTLADLYEMDDEQLKALGLTREEVNAAVEDALANAEAAGEGVEDDPNAGEGAHSPAPTGAAGEGAPAGAGVGAGVETSAPATAMKAMERRLLHLENKDRARTVRMKQEAEEKQLNEIEEKAMTLAKQRDESIELAENLKAENDALRLAVKTGTRPVKAGVDNGLRMFEANGKGQLHEFQLRVKQIMESEKKTEGQAILMAQKENPGLHADWVMSLNRKREVTV